jgi:hypothetical protein
MSKEQRIYIDQVNTLPKMKIHITTGTNDFITEDIKFEVEAFNIKECKESLDYVLEKYMRLRK